MIDRMLAFFFTLYLRYRVWRDLRDLKRILEQGRR